MNHLFYFLSIFPIIYNIILLVSPKEFFRRFTILKNYKKPGSIELTPKQKKTYKSAGAIYLFYLLMNLVWNFIGLFTGQWIIFIFRVFIGYIPGRFLGWIPLIIKSVVDIAILLFIILNAYHFHINIAEKIWDLTK